MESFTVGPPFPRVSPLPLPHREDCWTEDATLTLLDAWGEYYLVLKRGILRKEHWQEVANTVNNRNGHDGRLIRSGIQCKNRIDTLKKRYKNEKARVSDTGDYIGTWPYFHQLDSLIWDQFLANEFSPRASTNNVRKTRSQKLPPWTNVPVGRRSKTQKRPRLILPVLDNSPDRNDAATVAAGNRKYAAATVAAGNRKKAAATVAAGYRKKAAATVAAVADSDQNSNGSFRRNGSEKRKRGKEIVEALEKFGEIYERVELEKQNIMVEMEKQRMQFIRELEFQRMQLLFEMQVQMQHNNRP